MCSVTAAIIGGGLILSAISTQQKAQAEKEAAEAESRRFQFEGQIARDNQVVQEQAAEQVLARGERQAVDVLARGSIAERLQRRDVDQLIGVERAALAGAGVEVDTGSALDLVVDTAGVGEFEARTIRANAARDARAIRENAEQAAFEFRTRGVSFQNQALLSDARSDVPDSSRATILGGAGSVLQGFALANQSGTFG